MKRVWLAAWVVAARATCNTSQTLVACVLPVRGSYTLWSVPGNLTNAVACNTAGDGYFTLKTIHDCTSSCVSDDCNAGGRPFHELPKGCGRAWEQCAGCGGTMDVNRCTCTCPFSRVESIVIGHLLLLGITAFLLV